MADPVREDEGSPLVVLVPHTHWDREWWQPFDAFLRQLVDMMDALIDTLDRDPGFAHFHLDGQVAMVDDYLEVRPEREPDVRRLAAAGRISLGPWYTQMDEFLVSGESLIRNLETGLRRARNLGGGLMLGYLPDQFGHIGQMPQILGAAGIERAVVWRGVPAAIDRTAFWWDSPDGSRVLTEYLAFGYGLGWHLNHAADAGDLAAQLRNAVGLLAPMSVRDRFLVTVGGDHQIAQTRVPPLLAEANAGGGPRGEIASLERFLDGPEPEGLPEWRGELRSAARAHLLPNVYSARVHQKRERGRVEALVERYAEPLSALVPGFEWPARALDRAWRLLLWNGAHDSVCGCSVDQVARDVDVRYAEARGLAQGIVDRAMTTLASRVGVEGVLRFNPSPFERDGVPGLGWLVGGQGITDEPVDALVEKGRIEAGGVRLRLVDEFDMGDLYNFCPDPYTRPAGPVRIEAGPGAFEARFDGMTVSARLRRRSGERFVVLEGRIENERPDHRLRLHVELPERADGSIAVSPFELVHRPPASEGSDLEWPSRTWPARGAVLAGGVAVLHEGVFEYEVVDGRELAVTLLRCVGTISRQSIASRPWAAGPDIPTPEAQMIGRTEFRIGILADATPELLLRAWERFALSLLETPAPGGGDLADTGRLLELDLASAALSSIRRADVGVEIRMWNPTDRAIHSRVGDLDLTLAPARIETLAIEV
jgi:Glycosyl hydrolases family 38 N-terminal domain/Alpha mannosidase middle domain